jgi:methyltransferase family protein
MGASPGNFDVIADLHRRGCLPTGGSIADLGCTQLRDATPEDVRRFLGHFGKTPPNEEIARLATHNTFITEHMKAVGFSYRAFDVVVAPNCEWLDLNRDEVPKRWRGHFDLVLNFGTTEHVINQFNAFRTLHDLAKPQGGLIYSLFLRGGYMDHGLLHYSDRFVDLLCQANRYETVMRMEQSVPGTECTWVVLRRTRDEPFAPPIDIQLGEGFPPLAERPKKNALLARLFG